MPSVASISVSSPMNMLEQLPAASQVGKTMVGGIDLNKARMALVDRGGDRLSPSPDGFTASQLAARVRAAANKAHHIWPPPRRLRSKKTPRQTNRPPDRPNSPLRAVAERSPCDDGAPRPAR